MNLDPLSTLLAAVLVLLVGQLLNRLIPLLSRYNIPEPITGGLLVAGILTLAQALQGFSVSFDSSLKPTLMLAFFSAVGLSADLSLLRQGGKRLFMFVLVLMPFLFLQNGLGVLISKSLDMHPLMGLVGGSITLVGGHGTGGAYADRFAEVNNIQSIMELSMTSATLGLVLGGLIGGPVAHYLIKRYRLADVTAAGALQAQNTTSEQQELNMQNLVPALAAMLAALIGGQAISDWIGDSAVTVPTFLCCLLLGVVIRNVGRPAGLHLSTHGIDLLASINLSLFLAFTMMALNLSSVFALAGPLLLILIAQALLVMVFSAWVIFRALGRDYEAAVMSAAFCGFAMGATATAIANMQAITQRFGVAPQAFIVVPLVGAFLIDLINALVITGYLSVPWIGG